MSKHTDEAVDAIVVPFLPHCHDKEGETRRWLRGILETYRQEILAESDTVKVLEDLKKRMKGCALLLDKNYWNENKCRRVVTACFIEAEREINAAIKKAKEK